MKLKSKSFTKCPQCGHTEPKPRVTVNTDQQLYVIPHESGGYSCLGVQVCAKRTEQYAKWLNVPVPAAKPGTLAAYNAYRKLIRQIQKTGRRCNVALTPQLIGLEGKRVEVVDQYKERRRFIVGKSTGFIPIHIELSRRDSSGGTAVVGAPFTHIQILEEVRK